MQPSIPVPTDNIYKFACLFGLALIVSAIFSYVNTYSSSLDRKIRYSEVVIPLEAKSERTKAEEQLLALNKKLLEVTRANENTTYGALFVVLASGVLLSIVGAARWSQVVQSRDDRLAELQIRKLAAEVAKLEADARVERAPNDG